jgi:hypothetical protein
MRMGTAGVKFGDRSVSCDFGAPADTRTSELLLQSQERKLGRRSQHRVCT